ncbi:hypothetical protein AWB73_00250 [Caballeronia turbans]|nr:hypothetical protein AWB73_00250 [Caballeronia turbans]
MRERDIFIAYADDRVTQPLAQGRMHGRRSIHRCIDVRRDDQRFREAFELAREVGVQMRVELARHVSRAEARGLERGGRIAIERGHPDPVLPAVALDGLRELLRSIAALLHLDGNRHTAARHAAQVAIVRRVSPHDIWIDPRDGCERLRRDGLEPLAHRADLPMRTHASLLSPAFRRSEAAGIGLIHRTQVLLMFSVDD